MPDNMIDKRAPMPSAPMKYRANGEVAWGEMWDSYCVLALDGGPPHRESMLCAPTQPDVGSEGYRFAVKEIVRGIREVSGLRAEAAAPGWIGVECASASMAAWLVEAINEENVQAFAAGQRLFVPAGDDFTLITAVAKTTHYWREHLPAEVKQTLAVQAQMALFKRRLTDRLARLIGRGSGKAKGLGEARDAISS